MTDLDDYTAAMPANRQQVINDKGRRLASAFFVPDDTTLISLSEHIDLALNDPYHRYY